MSQELEGNVSSEVEEGPAPRLAAFLKDAERVFVNRKCLSYIERARDICLAPMLTVKEVGAANSSHNAPLCLGWPGAQRGASHVAVI